MACSNSIDVGEFKRKIIDEVLKLGLLELRITKMGIWLMNSIVYVRGRSIR